MSVSFVTNKCRVVLNAMQKEMSTLLRVNQDNVNYVSKRQV